jgi:alkane 1-monooxygenase
LLEILLGNKSLNLDENAERKAKQTTLYSVILYGYVPIQYVVLALAFSTALHSSLQWWEWMGLFISVAAANGGIGITIAHELIHRPLRWERALGELLLLSVGYMHFSIEHVFGHHKLVATPLDPASARRGQSFYSFWGQSIWNQWISAWNIEFKRLKKANLSAYSVQNKMIWFVALPVLFCLAVSTLWNAHFLWFFPAQAMVCFSLLEAVNYLEHYGLERMEIKPGKFEHVTEHHSWNSDAIISRLFLFELTRHSDHHAHEARPYQVLRSHDESPHLPTGYPGMIVLALFPPLWFSVMNKRLDEYVSAT